MPVNAFAQQVLLSGAEKSEQALRHIGFLLDRAVLVLRVLAAGQLQAYAVIQGAEPRFITCQPQYALAVGQVKRQQEGVAQVGQYLLNRAVAIEITVIAQVSLDGLGEGFIDQSQQGHLASGVLCIDHQRLKHGPALGEGGFGSRPFAGLLHLQCKQV